jgi:hypothetical protein
MRKAIAAALEGRKYLGLGTEGGLSVAIPQLAAPGDPVLVEAHHPEDELELDVWATSIADGVTRYHSILRRLGGGRYERVISTLEPGTYEIWIEGLADGIPQRISELVTILPTDIE